MTVILQKGIAPGIDIYQVSKRLGHSSISTTLDTYGHLTKEDLQIVIDTKEQENE